MASSKALDIRNSLITLIEPIQKDGENAFIEVKGHPRGEFDGFPSVRVLPGDQTTTKAAMGQNDRTNTYIVRTHLKARDDGSEFDDMYVLTDLLIDILDVADFNNALNIGTFILNTTRGDWFEDDSQAGPILCCDINVAVSYSKDNF